MFFDSRKFKNLFSFLKRRGWCAVSVEIKKSKVHVHAEAIGSLFVYDQHHPGTTPIGAALLTLVVREKGDISSLASVLSHAGLQL
jgi:hypothetical protein